MNQKGFFILPRSVRCPFFQAGQQYAIDWDALNRLSTPDTFQVKMRPDGERKRLGVRSADYAHAVVTSDYTGEVQRFHVMKVHDALTPTSMTTFEETAAEHVWTKYKVQVQVVEQPMIEVRHCSKA